MSACPFARGFIPQELDCALARDADARLPWWRRLLHMLRGDYWCENLGSLPCARHESLISTKQERTQNELEKRGGPEWQTLKAL